MKTVATKYFVSGICCPAEEAIVRRQLDELLGREGYRFNSLTSELTIGTGVDATAIALRLRDCGFRVRAKHELEQPQRFWGRHGDVILSGLAALVAGTGILLDHLGGQVVLSRGLLLVAIAGGGWKVFLRGYRGARNLSLDMNFLMSIAVLGALTIGKWDEAAAVMVLFTASLMLESYSTARTRRAIQSLMLLSPDEACVLKNGEELTVSARTLEPGDVLVVRPGERIPLDGTVVDGISSVNEAPITGESTPAVKERGEPVFAGSINERGSLRVKVTKRFEDTTLARIVHAVEEAQHARAPLQHFVDRFARIYTPVVLALAVVVAVVPPLLLAQEWMEWLYRALVMLVIACPCALVISTPVTLVSALTRGARTGILIKGGKYLEALTRVAAIAFDKTGTLTEGRPKVTDVIPLNSMPRGQILQLVAAMEHRSEHHVATAVMAEVGRCGMLDGVMRVQDFEALPGRGVRASIEGTTYFLGNHLLCHERGFCSPTVERTLDRLSAEGKTAVVLGREGEAIGIIALKDVARQEAQRALERLRRGGIQHTVMLSGDHQATSEHIAAEIGMEHVQAELLPEQKVAVVQELKARYGTVAMVGDGINDAPALAAASVGIAMGGSGTDAALETADVVLMADDIGRLPYLFALSRKALSIVRQNIALALGLKILFLTLSIGGVATLWMAILADDGAALLVIVNGLRLLSFRDVT